MASLKLGKATDSAEPLSSHKNIANICNRNWETNNNSNICMFSLCYQGNNMASPNHKYYCHACPIYYNMEYPDNLMNGIFWVIK